MAGKRKSPRIPGLAHFEEQRVPRGIVYKSQDTAVIGIGINEVEFQGYVTGFPQMDGVTLVPVEFGQVRGWKCFGKPGGPVAYVLERDGGYTLLNVEPFPRTGTPDISSVESALHSLIFK